MVGIGLVMWRSGCCLRLLELWLTGLPVPRPRRVNFVFVVGGYAELRCR
jgi:hypothetical protein